MQKRRLIKNFFPFFYKFQIFSITEQKFENVILIFLFFLRGHKKSKFFIVKLTSLEPNSFKFCYYNKYCFDKTYMHNLANPRYLSHPCYLIHPRYLNLLFYLCRQLLGPNSFHACIRRRPGQLLLILPLFPPR